MVKRNSTASISEDDGEPGVLNENGKRPSDMSKEGVKRVKTKSLYRQPTVNELNRLQETEMLFNSNLFRLQIDEVLDEVKLTEKLMKKFQVWFTELKDHMETIPEDDTEYDLTEKTLFKKLKVSSPMSKKLNKTKCVFKFYKFKNIDIVGSYALGCSVNHKLQINLQIKVPAKSYTKNDSINYRYHKKRSAYLAVIASHLNKLNIIEDLKYSWFNGDQSKPVLELKPKGKLGNHLSVRINLTCEEEAYKLSRFTLARNNLRETWLYSDEKTENTSEVGPPTPYYNNSVLSDLTADINHTYLNNTLENSENLKQAIVLLKIWIRQRHLQVSGHIISLFVAYLVDTKRINNIMSSYQIVRNIWIALKSSEWDMKGISLNKDTSSPSIAEFHQHFPVVFLDKTGYYNICWQMTKGTYMALKRECELAVDMLDNANINSFIPLFMTPVKDLLQFDHILRFKDLAKLKQAVIAKTSRESRLNYGQDELALVINTLHTLMSKGLGDRVDLILELVEADFSCPVNSKVEKTREGHVQKLSFGFILNPDNAYNTVEKGPPANLPEAEEFRSFWGEKSELRRFQDGSITETCVWEGEYLLERRGVTKQILDYLLKLKYELSPGEVFHVQGQCDSLQRCKLQGGAALEALGGSAVSAFHALAAELRALTDLPLHISAVHGVSPVLSHASPAPPAARPAPPTSRPAPLKSRPAPLTSYTPVCRAVIEMGHSGKWPGDIEAFRCLKAAFHLHISERLTKQFGLKTRAYEGHFDVMKDGLVFRLEIGHQKEITIAKREIVNGVVVHRDNEESERLMREIVLLPKLRGALNGLQSKHSAYGPAACIFKRWLSCHLLSPPAVDEVLSELVCAHVFLCPWPCAPPASPLAAFLRVLHLLVNRDWEKEILVLDFNGDMKREEVAELEGKLRSESAGSLAVLTSQGAWTVAGPVWAALRRARALADTALRYIHEKLDSYEDNILAAFVPSLTGYDVVIHLRSELVPLDRLRLDRPLLPLPPQPDRDSHARDVIPLVEFNVVERYLSELRSAYGDFALFFHDTYGGDVIAVLWKPDVNDIKPFQVSNANALIPVTVNGEVKHKVNVAALVEDFRILGEGLVRDIIVNN